MKASTPSKWDAPPSRWTVVRWGIVAIVLVAVVSGFFALSRYRGDAPRREALSVMAEVERAIASSHAEKTLPLLALPSSAAAKSPEEKTRWIADVLRDEVSAEGLAEIRRHARFGPLAEVFPAEAQRWADTAGVPVEDCVAFRMERDNIRAEVVLHKSPSGFRIVRCNNVKQMAPAPKS